MKALINQKTGEVYFENHWMPWISRSTGYPLAIRSRGYALCEDATSDNASDYIVSEKIVEDDDGFETVYLTAVQKPIEE